MTTALPMLVAADVAAADAVKATAANAAVPDLQACIAEFVRRIMPNNAAYGAARETATHIAADLRAELYRDPDAKNDHYIAGSVGKLTSIAPINVVDLLYVLPPKLGISDPENALKTAWAILKSKHEGALIAEDRTGVLVAAKGITVRAIPCLSREGAFMVPSTNGWMLTNPIAEAATLRLADSMYGPRLRMVIGILKAWRLHSAAPISAFALELLAQDFFASAPRPHDLASALADFWAWAQKRTPATLKTPGASTAVVVDNAWHGKAKGAYWRVTLAQSNVAQHKVPAACQEWREIVGPLFPVAGETVGLLPLSP